jgi:hypothetical protein
MRTLTLPLDTLGPEARPEIPNLRFPPGVANAGVGIGIAWRICYNILL